MEQGVTRPAAPGERLGAVNAALRRQLVVLAVVIGVSVLLRLVTWDVLADGAQARYVKTTVFGGVAAALVWLLVWIQTGTGSRIPLLAAIAVLLSGDAIHYTRLANPITHGGPVQAFTATFAGEAAARSQWEFELAGAGTVAFEPGAVRLESPPNASAYMVARLAAPPDVRVNWWLPVGLAERERTERLTWRASIRRTGAFYVVTELRRLLVQAVSYGVHVTYPDPANRNTSRGYDVTHPAGNDGQVHEWQLARDARQITLSIDGRQVWSAPQFEALNQVKLGETKRDPEHGGGMRVEAVRYTSVLERG